MPIHDWSRVDAGVFHDFHQAWTIAIRNALNEGLLPDEFYAMAEQVAEGPIPDVVTLERKLPEASPLHEPLDWGQQNPPSSPNAVAVESHPPTVTYSHELDLGLYASRATRVAILHVSGDRVVGYIEIVSPGNKHSLTAINQFCRKLAAAIRNGIHALVIDLHAPTPRDPNGIHAKIWQQFEEDKLAPAVSAELPFSLVSYRSDLATKAYFEPTGLGSTLIDMPIFLTPDYDVTVPLEATYLDAWRGVPKRWKVVIEM